MKNAVPKNDKKKRKQLTEEIAKLEADLNQKHEEELRHLTSHTEVNNLTKTCFCCDIAMLELAFAGADSLHRGPAPEDPTELWWCSVKVSLFKMVVPKPRAVWQRLSHALLSHSFKVEEVLNGVESMKMGDGEQEEVKQPRVTKAQKRRVNYLLPHISWPAAVSDWVVVITVTWKKLLIMF